ncbi:MAG: helix-turn-helix domain-containing protein [Halobacteriaceae archaeon]
MVRDFFHDEQAPELQDVLDALDDDTCRQLIHELEEPMTAKELAEECDIPLSTTYRKVDLLHEARLVREQTEIREDGQHTSRYQLAFEEVRISLDNDRYFEVQIKKRPERPEERLESLWSEVRKET